MFASEWNIGLSVSFFVLSQELDTNDIYYNNSILTSIYQVISRIFFFENPYYVATVQNDLKDQYSICFSVWDMNFGSCVRRMFLPDQSVYVHMIYNDTTIIVTENRKLKLLDLKRFTIIQVLQGQTFDQRPPFVIYVKETKGIYVSFYIGFVVVDF